MFTKLFGVLMGIFGGVGSFLLQVNEAAFVVKLQGAILTAAACAAASWITVESLKYVVKKVKQGIIKSKKNGTT